MSNPNAPISHFGEPEFALETIQEAFYLHAQELEVPFTWHSSDGEFTYFLTNPTFRSDIDTFGIDEQSVRALKFWKMNRVKMMPDINGEVAFTSYLFGDVNGTYPVQLHEVWRSAINIVSGEDFDTQAANSNNSINVLAELGLVEPTIADEAAFDNAIFDLMQHLAEYRQRHD